MNIQRIREKLEGRQIGIYFGAMMLGTIVALQVPSATAIEAAINPALALMLFVTFLQIPITDLGQAITRGRFMLALLTANFIVIPLLVAALVPFLPNDPMVRMAVLLVLLAPCIDYVVTFSHLGRADARLLLAATPVLLIVQMLLLPIYLGIFLGRSADDLIRVGPFVHAFIWLIAVPLALAAVVQFWGARSQRGERMSAVLGLLSVPATAGVLFVVIAAVAPQLGPAATHKSVNMSTVWDLSGYRRGHSFHEDRWPTT
jgi:ACR3 family arsenite efflux pump ArsB